jgi:hypothetical protein
LGASADHRPTIRLDAGDAGALLRWAGLYRHMRDGMLNIAMYAPDADGAIEDGVASLRSFTIADDSVLRPLTRLTFDRHARTPRLAVARLRVAFKSQAGRVTVSEGALTGEPIGATLDGSFDLAQSRLDLRGVVIPSVQFSQVVPIYFPLYFGLIGSDYALSGSPSAPVLRVDPLRTLAPGILRKLFEFRPHEHSLGP